MSVVGIRTKAMDRYLDCSKNINANYFACELWVKRVGAFGVVLIATNDPYILFCILLNCIMVILSIRYENALFGNYFLKCYIVKIILISFS